MENLNVSLLGMTLNSIYKTPRQVESVGLPVPWDEADTVASAPTQEAPCQAHLSRALEPPWHRLAGLRDPEPRL